MFYLGQRRYLAMPIREKGRRHWCERRVMREDIAPESNGKDINTEVWKQQIEGGAPRLILAHLKQYGHGVLAISRLLPGESEAGNLSGIRLRRHHWQTMGSCYFKVQPVLIIKKENWFNIVSFFSDSDNIRNRVLPFSRGLEIEWTGRKPC